MYIIFTPIFYINNKPHIGHVLTIKIANFYKRLLKMRGHTVECYTGTDEHGEKVHNSFVEYAITNKIKDIKEYCIIRRQEFQHIFNILNIHNDYIYHTYTDNHYINIECIFHKLIQMNFIYRGTYEGMYSLKEEKYIDNVEYDSLSDMNKKFVVHKREEGFYLNLQLYKQRIKENLYNTMLSKHYIDYCNNIIDNAKDVFITRTGDKNTHAIYIKKYNVFLYVWFEAIMYYIIVIMNEPYKHKNILIIIGKDIISFHVVLLPTLSYMLLDDNPFKLIVHGLIQIDNIKISKSYNNFEHANKISKTYGNMSFASFLANSVNKDFNLNESYITTYIHFIKNNVRNCYKRYYKVLNQYYDFIINNINTIHIQAKYTDTHLEIYKIANYILNKDNIINSNNMFQQLSVLSNLCNSLMDTHMFWVFDTQKALQIFNAFKIIKCMMHIEYVLQHDNIEHILNYFNVNIHTHNILNCVEIIKNVQNLNMFDLTY